MTFKQFVPWFALAVLISSSTMLALGMRYGRESAAKAAIEYDARMAQVTAYVVERNPDATIREFKEFARNLLQDAFAADMDYRLIMAVIDKESQFNPRAIGTSGEIGLMQIMPATAALMAKNLNWSWYEPPTKKDGKYVSLGSLGDPKLNIYIGIQYLKERRDKFGDTKTALQAYNRGDDKAREHRPNDTYAADIAWKYIALVPRLP